MLAELGAKGACGRNQGLPSLTVGPAGACNRKAQKLNVESGFLHPVLRQASSFHVTCFCGSQEVSQDMSGRWQGCANVLLTAGRRESCQAAEREFTCLGTVKPIMYDQSCVAFFDARVSFQEQRWWSKP